MDEPTPDEIAHETENICHSEAFDKQRRNRAILRYIVDAAINNRTINEYTIAQDVFGIVDFDPTIHSNVRVQRGKLLRSLACYYKEEGKESEIRIDIDTGYVARATRRCKTTTKSAPIADLRGLGLNARHLDLSPLQSPGSAAIDFQRHLLKAQETANRLWPQLAHSFAALCTRTYIASVDPDGLLPLHAELGVFFHALANYRVYVTAVSERQGRIYPATAWLERRLLPPLRRFLVNADSTIQVSPYPSDHEREDWECGDEELESRGHYSVVMPTDSGDGQIAVSKSLYEYLNLLPERYAPSRGRPSFLEAANAILWFHPEGYIVFYNSSYDADNRQDLARIYQLNML